MFKFRHYEESDFLNCQMIYKANVDQGLIPSKNEYYDEFVSCLSRSDILSIVAVVGSQVVAVGNIHYEEDSSVARCSPMKSLA